MADVLEINCETGEVRERAFTDEERVAFEGLQANQPPEPQALTDKLDALDPNQTLTVAQLRDLLT